MNDFSFREVYFFQNGNSRTTLQIGLTGLLTYVKASQRSTIIDEVLQSKDYISEIISLAADHFLTVRWTVKEETRSVHHVWVDSRRRCSQRPVFTNVCWLIRRNFHHFSSWVKQLNEEEEFGFLQRDRLSADLEQISTVTRSDNLQENSWSKWNLL